MEFADVIKSYLEVGLLGLCGVLIVYLFYINYKRSMNRDDKNSSALNKKVDDMLDYIQKQNSALQEQSTKNTETLINSIVAGVTGHVPTVDENLKLTKISEEIDKILQYMLLETGASRTNLIQFHNGGKGINRQSFLKMSMTNEQVQLGVKPVMSEFKDQFRSTLAYFVKELNDIGFCMVDDYEDMKNRDNSFYEFLADRKVQSKYGMAIHNNDGMVIAFVCIEYEDKTKARRDLVEKVFADKQKIIETLLNL